MTDSKGPDVKEKILESAMALWNEKGYAQATMRELVRVLDAIMKRQSP